MSGCIKATAERHRQLTGVVLALCAVTLSTGVLGGTALAESRRHAALIVDANTGRVLSEANANDPRFPASLTKMMTLYVLFEMIEQKKLTYDTPIVVSAAATRVQPSKLGLAAGDSITVRDAAKALIAKSANDVAVAVGEHIAGSEQKFAAVMTQTARRIGMKSTTFKNAHGLPNDEQVTTARDMVTLGLRLQDDFPKHYPLFSTRDFSYGSSTYRNHNSLLLTYEGTDGIKTGYIGASGFNLVANVKRGDKHVIGVVFGGTSASARNQTMKTLLNMALFKASTVKTRQVTPVARNRPDPAAAVSSSAVPTPSVAARPPVQVVAVAPPVVPAAVVRADVKAETPSAKTPEVQITRVRPLLVAPKAPAQAPLTPGPVQATTQDSPVGRPAPQMEQVVSTAPSLATGLAAQGALQGAVRAPAGSPRGTQLAVATPALPPGASRLNGPVAAANAVHLQVGAYATKADAEKQIASVRQAGGAAVATLAGEALSATSNGKAVFRARFTGVDPAQAGSICNDLRRRQIDCMVARPE